MRLDDEVKTILIDKSRTMDLQLITNELPSKYHFEVIGNSMTIFHNRYDHHWRKILTKFVELFFRDITGDTFYYDIKGKEEKDDYKI